MKFFKIKNWISKLFSSPKELIQVSYIEQSTECDKCENLHKCINDGNLMEVALSDDNYRHYIIAIGCICLKGAYESNG